MRRWVFWVVWAVVGCGTVANPAYDGPGDDDDGGEVPCSTDGDCDDSDACNGVETCAQGICASGEPIKCDDGVDCTRDTCDPTDGACVILPDHSRCPAGDLCRGADGCVPGPSCDDDAGCDDGIHCNGVETCDTAFGCLAGDVPSCDDGTECTVDRCDVQRDACGSVPDHAACDDGESCNGAEECEPNEGCVAKDIPDCDDGVACTRDTCRDGGDACVQVPDDGRCDDGDACNGSETCDAEDGCGAGIALDCDDGIACTVDDCDAVLGCVHAPLDALCSDGVFCNGPEDCALGVGCVAALPPACGDADACTTDSCDEGLDRCVHPIVDVDGDGHGSLGCGGDDCDDADASVHPGAPEICDGVSNDCDALVDEGCVTNDVCADAIDMGGGGTFVGTTAGTANDYDSCGATSDGPDVVYRFTLAAREIVYLDTFGSDYDTILSIRDGCAGTEVVGGCDDDACGFESQIAMELAAGTYYVVVDGWDGDAGDFFLHYRKVGCAGATRMSADGSYSGTTCGAGSDTSASCGGVGPDRAYFFTQCPGDHVVTADTCGDLWDTVLAVREDGCGNAAEEVACDDDACVGLQSSLATVVDEGIYFVIVDGYGEATCGNYTVDVDLDE